VAGDEATPPPHVRGGSSPSRGGQGSHPPSTPHEGGSPIQHTGARVEPFCGGESQCEVGGLEAWSHSHRLFARAKGRKLLFQIKGNIKLFENTRF
jgi:hypothetical protein